MKINKEWTIPASVGVVSFGLGAAFEYILGQRQFKEKNKAIEELKTELEFKRADLDREFNKQIQQATLVIRELKETFQLFKKFMPELESQEESEVEPESGSEPEPEPELNVVESEPEESEELEADESEEELSTIYTSESNVRKEEIMAVREERETLAKVFANPANDGWDWDQELARRDKRYPYVIHRDEYFNKEEPFYSQDTLTYYAGDDILTDSNDIPLYDARFIVGNLEFGRGSADPNVCYVRNDRLQAEYEVLCEHGTFGVMVLGDHVQDLIKKSKIRHSLDKFREDD